MSTNTVKNVTVIGAGDMGHGIAEVALIAGYHVVLRDINDEYLSKGVSRIMSSLEKLVEKGRVERTHYDKIQYELLRSTTALPEAVAEADLVIEAIPEIMELKKETFAEMERAARPDTILATNTSTMSITEIASATDTPERVIGMHYFNPAVIMKLVEVIRGEKSSDTAMDTAVQFCKDTGKIPVRVNKDVPGFIVNRTTAPRNALMGIIIENKLATPEEVDAMMRNFGMPMGPFELRDFTGIDVGVGVLSYYAEAIHPDYGPPKDLLQKFEAGDYGKKTGKGYYDWSEGRPKIDLTKSSPNFDPYDMIAVQINEATKLVEMGVCSPEDVDVAVTNATGVAKGPMAIAREMAPEDLTARLDRLATDYKKEIFRPTQYIRDGKYL